MGLMCECWDFCRGLWTRVTRHKLHNFGLRISWGPKGKTTLLYLHGGSLFTMVSTTPWSADISSWVAKIDGAPGWMDYGRGRKKREGQGDSTEVLSSGRERRMQPGFEARQTEKMAIDGSGCCNRRPPGQLWLRWRGSLE
jgi:hypothetical protein